MPERLPRVPFGRRVRALIQLSECYKLGHSVDAGFVYASGTNSLEITLFLRHCVSPDSAVQRIASALGLGTQAARLLPDTDCALSPHEK